jgi:hypothetical protein
MVSIRSRFFLVLALLVLAAGLGGCGAGRLPLETLQQDLKDAPTYSIILEDMDVKGNFFPTYYQRYKVVQESKEYTTDWMQVPEEYYRRTENFLGMTLVSKKDGKIDSDPGPAGYSYVGNPRYGQWQEGPGGSFWVFYGQYRLLSDLLGGRRVFRTDYSNYERYRSQGRPYYGENNEFGTNGSVTRGQKPDFFARRMARLEASRQAFSDRVASRTGRTRMSGRGRSFGMGK